MWVVGRCTAAGNNGRKDFSKKCYNSSYICGVFCKPQASVPPKSPWYLCLWCRWHWVHSLVSCTPLCIGTIISLAPFWRTLSNLASIWHRCHLRGHSYALPTHYAHTPIEDHVTFCSPNYLSRLVLHTLLCWIIDHMHVGSLPVPWPNRASRA